jgi:uncharacterized membrane protein YkoI
MTKKFFSVFVAVLILVGLVGCAASEKPDQSGVAQSAQKNVSTLTVEKAEEIALNHAGLTRDQVRFDRTEYDIDDGVEAYEIEFRSSDWEYDYKIHGKTGEVLLSEKDQEGRATATVPSPAQPAQSSSKTLTAEEAEEIALNHAGLTRDQVRFDRTEYDVDHGTPEYEIEFRQDGWEYSYEIHAKTGKVISNEKERDD